MCTGSGGHSRRSEGLLVLPPQGAMRTLDGAAVVSVTVTHWGMAHWHGRAVLEQTVVPWASYASRLPLCPNAV